MKRILSISFLLIALFLFHNKSTAKKIERQQDHERPFLLDCRAAQSQTEIYVNKIRTGLRANGGLWNLRDGFEVPDLNTSTVIPYAATYGAGLWLGSNDLAGNLKVAASTFGNSRGNTDFFAGPLSPDEGRTTSEICQQWDRLFKVRASDIQLHQRNYEAAKIAGELYAPADIPDLIKGWPGRGNPFFEDVSGFQLPNTVQGLAPFFDNDADGIYNPQQGDFPILAHQSEPVYADEMIWWAFNDAGGVHTESNGDIMRVEVHGMSYAYATPELEYTVFQSYKTINRSVTPYDSMQIGLWVDPASSNCFNVNVGSTPSKDLAYTYTFRKIENCGLTDPREVEDFPLFGLKILKSPLDDNFEEVGMSSFTIYTRSDISSMPRGAQDPQVAQEYYNLLTGSWTDGTRLTTGGTGYNPTSTDYTNYAFPGTPNDPSSWSMCDTSLFGPVEDFRMIQSSGGFSFDPGAVKEITYGAYVVKDITYSPCPDITPLLELGDRLKDAFDNGFAGLVNTTESEIPEQLLSEITLYPNPAFSNESTAKTTLHIDGLPAQYTVELFTIDGKLLNTWQSQTGISNKNNPQFNQQLITETNVSAGMYFVKIHAPDLGMHTMKWVVQ